MLCLGMNEQIVRKISGHAPNSKEFYKYVSYSQNYLDKEIDEVYRKLKQKTLLPLLLFLGTVLMVIFGLYSPIMLLP